MSAFISTLAILDGVAGLLQALPVPAGFGSGNAFAAVRTYARENLVTGLKELYQYDDRICLLIPTRWTHQSEQDGRWLIIRRHLEFVGLITDRNYGGEATAFTGEAGVNPGALLLGEVVTAALMGASVGLTGVCIYAGGGEPFRLSDTERESAASRECWAQTFLTPAGEHRHQARAALQILP